MSCAYCTFKTYIATKPTIYTYVLYVCILIKNVIILDSYMISSSLPPVSITVLVMDPVVMLLYSFNC